MSDKNLKGERLVNDFLLTSALSCVIKELGEYCLYQALNLQIRNLAKHGFSITRELIEDTIQQPDKLMVSKMGRLIAQKAIDKTHLIRVIYIRKDDEVKVITFYPTRRQRYEY